MIEDVTEVKVDKDLIKDRVWRYGREEVWRESLSNNRVPFNGNHMKKTRLYMRLPKYDSRLFFAYRIGELQFKEYRRGEFRKRFGNTKCFADGCSQPDTLKHAVTCDGYNQTFQEQKLEHVMNPDIQIEFIDYLKKLDWERARKYGLPILYRKGSAGNLTL